MNIEDILDSMEDMLDHSWSLPLTGGRGVVDAEKLRDLIDDLRANMPDVIKQAKHIVADREEIQRDAKKEAEQIIRKAEARARTLVSQEEIVRSAQAQAAEIVAQAQKKSQEIRRSVLDYAENCLHKSEDTLTKALTDVRATRQGFRNAINRK